MLDGQLCVPLNTLMESLVGAVLLGLWQCQPITFDNPEARQATGDARARRSGSNFSASLTAPNHSPARPGRCSKTLISLANSTRFAPSSPFRKNNSLPDHPKSPLEIPPSHPSRGADRDRHGRGVGCGGRGSVRREKLFAGRLSVSEHGAQDDDVAAYGKTVWSWHPWLMSSCRW
jgi:hypothetical protein